MSKIVSLSSTLTARIPFEIITHIITHLPLSALITSALVSKTWLSLTRALYATHPSSLLTPLIIRRSTAPHILPLLASPYRSFTAHIRSLCIRPGKSVRMPRFTKCLRDAPIERLAVCPAALQAELWGAEEKRIGREREGREKEGEEILTWVGGYGCSLVELVLVGLHGATVQKFQGALKSMRSLRHLCLIDVIWADTSTGVGTSVFPDVDMSTWVVEQGGKKDILLCLRSLILDEDNINMVDWLNSVMRSGVAQITSLDLRSRLDVSEPMYSTDKQTADLIMRHYRALGGALQELDIYPLAIPVTLQYTPYLQRVWFHDVAFGVGATGQWVTDSLETLVVPSCLESIAIEVGADPDILPLGEEGVIFDWDRFGQVVGDPKRFPCLRRVEVVLAMYNPQAARNILDVLEKAMMGMRVEVEVREVDWSPVFGFLVCGRVWEDGERFTS